jgi:competence protein ComEC
VLSLHAAAPFAVLGALVAGTLLGERAGPGDGHSALLVGIGFGGAALALRSAPRARTAVVLVSLVAVVTLGCASMQRAMHGVTRWPLADLVEARADVVAEVTLVEDPDGSRFTSRVLARLDKVRIDGSPRDGGGRTVLLVGEADAGPRLGVLAAGDRAVLRGWLRPLDGYDRRLRWRHAAARLDASRLLAFRDPDGMLATVANVLRGVVVRGQAGLESTERALVTGFLLGDTRALPDDVLAQFRAAGLSHLLAVSGANVAFVLALVGPALRRLPRSARLGTTLAVLVLFGAMTRWEPSVLRACAMAACAVLAVHLGRPARTTRVLALAATALVLVDPFLVHSVAFLLSCGASLGIALGAPPIARRLPGPAWFRESMATTVAAQVGVAPVLWTVFGSIPLVALPANLLAVPVAGPLTTWGLGAGIAAGLLGGVVPGFSALLAVPTRLLAQAVLGLADAASRAPMSLGLRTATLAGAAVLALGVAVRLGRMLRRHALVVPPR